MSERLQDLTEAVVDRINAGSYSQSFTATRAYFARMELKDVETLTVTVTPSGDVAEVVNRNETGHTMAVDVGIRKKVNDVDNDTLDPLADLVEEIKTQLRFANLDAVGAAWIGLEHGTPDRLAYLPEHLDKHRQFTAIMRVSYFLVQ